VHRDQYHVDVGAVVGQRQQQMLRADKPVMVLPEFDACELRLGAIDGAAIQGGDVVRP
jgi:hypothetical protein